MKFKALFIGLFVFGFAIAMQAQTNANQKQLTKKSPPSAQVTTKQAVLQQQQREAKADGKITPKERIEMKATEKKANKAVGRDGQ